MNKRYLLIIKNTYSIDTLSFYTLEEAKITVKNLIGITTIVDLDDKNIKWQGCE